MEASGVGGVGMALSVLERGRRRRSGYVRGRGWVGFDYKDKAHVDYYSSSSSSYNVIINNNKAAAAAGDGENGNKHSSKKKEKLKSIRKALSKDLSTLTHIYPHHPSLSEAAHVLIKHLDQLRADEEEKERLLENPYNPNLPTAEYTIKPPSIDSSSESSESSDSECEDMIPKNCSTTTQTAAVAVAPTVPQVTATPSLPLPLQLQEPKPLEIPVSCTQDCSNTTTQAIGETSSDKRIEVCMGGKCKKSGGVALLEEFGKLMGGVQGAVVGSKCMGKCKEGPNVRLKTSTPAVGLDDSVRTTPPNPVCVGVGPEDVNLIVAKFFGQDGLDVGLVS